MLVQLQISVLFSQDWIVNDAVVEIGKNDKGDWLFAGHDVFVVLLDVSLRALLQSGDVQVSILDVDVVVGGNTDEFGAHELTNLLLIILLRI